MGKDARDFWDIDDLIPPRKARPGKPFDAAHTEAVEIAVPPAKAENVTPEESVTVVVSPRQGATEPPRPHENGERYTHTFAEYMESDASFRVELEDRFSHTKKRAECELRYAPEHALLKEVRIYPWSCAYHYYEQFRIHAEKLQGREGHECPEADFFSYMPQYTQLNSAQLQYYLWWRTNFRNEVYLPVAYSYLLLYLYEEINLSDVLPPETVQRDFLRLWLAYRKRHPRLDVLIREWLCDHALLYRLPPPMLPREQFADMIGGCRLKEFYVSGWQKTGGAVPAILLFCNNYDYKKSKFYRADTAELYDRVLAGAVAVALAALQGTNEAGDTRTLGTSTILRDSFSGAICSCRFKRKIEVDYSSFSNTHELRYLMTDVLKYAENAIRAAIGVKSRLTVYRISTELRHTLDAYLTGALPHKAVKKGEETLPEYERRYDLPARPLSPERAAKIEAGSWETTKKLVEAFDGMEAEPAEPPPAPAVQPQPVEEEPGSLVGALGEFTAFVHLAAVQDGAAQRAFAADRGMMTDAVADRINTLCGELMGDIILEDVGGVYALIEDYRDDLKKAGVLP